MENREYVVQTADTGEFVPLFALDRYQALRQLSDTSIEALYMESQSPDSAFSGTGTYARHLVRLKNGDYFILEQDPRPNFNQDDIDKVYVSVNLN